MRALIAFTLLVGLAAGGCIYAPIDLGLENLGKVHEVTLVDSESEDKVLLLPVDGEISDHADGGGALLAQPESTVSHVRDFLELADQDRRVKAIVVRINSPGGGVTASDIIYRELAAWKKTSGKPIVAVLMDVAASGGYYIAQAADRIVAHPTSITGSIGVIAFLPNLHGLTRKIGVDVNVVKSGRLKDMGNPFRPLETDERQVFQALIDDMYDRFVDVIAEGRKKAGLTRDRILKLADGRVYTAADAKKERLIDEVGYLEEAIASAVKLSGAKAAKVITYERKGIGTGRHTVYSGARPLPIGATLLGAPSATENNVVKLEAPGLAPRSRPVFNYLWMPGID